MSGKLVAIVLACIVIGAVVGIAGYKWYVGQQPVTPTWTPQQYIPTKVANLEIKQEDTEFDFSSVIASDGSVSADAEKTTTITIYNNDTTDAKNVVISLVNTINGKEGLPTALKVDEFEVYVTATSGYLEKTYYLFRDGQYNKAGGFNIGTIDAGSKVTITLGVKVLQADPDTFSDGKTYTLKVYILQGNTAYEQATFSVLT